MRVARLALAISVGLAVAPAMGQETPAQPAESGSYQATAFLEAMVALRRQALTCAPFLNGNPDAATLPIVQYFSDLGQDLPNLADDVTMASLSRFILPQAATICRDKLTGAYHAYLAQAATYMANKPDEYPVAPEIKFAPFCVAADCSTVR